MSRKLIIISSVLLLLVALSLGAMAQSRTQRHGGNGLHLGQSNTVMLEGKVTRIQITPGQGTPSLALSLGSKEVTVVLGPYRLLAEKKFDIAEGTRVSVQAIQSLGLENTFAAVQITNLDSGSTLILRDSDGMPQWAGGRFGRNGVFGCAGTGPSQLDLAAKTLLEGTVESVNMGLGQGLPNLTLTQANGKIVTVIASPFRLVRDAGFKIAIGDRMSVLAYPSLLHEGAYVAGELNNQTNGTTLSLRDAQGVPFGSTGAGLGCRGCGACPRSL